MKRIQVCFILNMGFNLMYKFFLVSLSFFSSFLLASNPINKFTVCNKAKKKLIEDNLGPIYDKTNLSLFISFTFYLKMCGSLDLLILTQSL